MMDDLTMMANAPVTPADVEKTTEADLGKAAAGETMPPPKEECEDCEDTRAGRIARRGQNPPAPETGIREAGAGNREPGTGT